MFDLFWTKVLALQRKYNVDEPGLPRKRKTPRHLEVGSGEGSPKEFYNQQYFECLEFVINAIKDRFDQPGYRTLKNLENLLTKAAKGEDYAEELAFVVNYYFDDISESSLSAQLENLTTAFASPTETPTLGTIKEYHRHWLLSAYGC